MAVNLLDRFRLVVGRRDVVLPVHAQRVLAYLAVSRSDPHGQLRTAVAGRLWGDVSNERAHASLRTAIWRIRQADERLVRADRGQIHLGVDVDVDVHRSMDLAQRLLSDDALVDPGGPAVAGLVADLLPGWEDEWLVLVRERMRQIHILALEALARRMYQRGLLVPALDAAYAAITAEPLRESAHAVLIDIHLAQGNLVEAHRQLDRYARLLWSEMALAPSRALVARVARPIVGADVGPARVSAGSG